MNSFTLSLSARVWVLTTCAALLACGGGGNTESSGPSSTLPQSKSEAIVQGDGSDGLTPLIRGSPVAGSDTDGNGVGDDAASRQARKGVEEFRRLAAKIDQHMQQLRAQGVDDTQAIIDRMAGYVPDLHKIWVGTSDNQLLALASEFPEFHRFALLMEQASEADRTRVLQPDEGTAEFFGQRKHTGDSLDGRGGT